MKKVILLCLMPFLFKGVSAQDIFKLKGIVISEKDNKPVGDCFIQYNNIGKSIYSNDIGEFEIKYNSKNPQDSLHIKHLGFIDQTISVSDLTFDKYLTIKLVEKTFDLKDVEISPLPNEETIIKNILTNSDRNYNSKNTFSNSFFRTYLKSDDHFDKLVEGDVYLQNTTFNPKKQKWDKHPVYVNKLRATENVGKIKEGANSNTNNLDEILMIYEGMLNDFFLHPMYPFNFKLKDVEYCGDHKILTLLFDYSNTSKGFVCNGNFKINDKSWAVEELVYNNRITEKKEDQVYSTSDSLKLRNLSDNFLIKFRLVEGKYHLGLFKRSFEKEIYPENKESFLFSINTEYLLNNVITDPLSSKGKRMLDRGDGLYKQACGLLYDPAFWDNYNLVVDDPEMEKVRNELNSNTDINDQYNKANKYPASSKKGKK